MSLQPISQDMTVGEPERENLRHGSAASKREPANSRLLEGLPRDFKAAHE